MWRGWVKITNCTKWTGGGKIPYRMRHRQNVKVLVNESLYNWLIKYQNKRKITIDYYTLSHNSKIILYKILNN